MIIKWELIVCYDDNTWEILSFEHPAYIEERDVHEDCIESHNKAQKLHGSPDIGYVGTYNTETID